MCQCECRRGRLFAQNRLFPGRICTLIYARGRFSAIAAVQGRLPSTCRRSTETMADLPSMVHGFRSISWRARRDFTGFSCPSSHLVDLKPRENRKDVSRRSMRSTYGKEKPAKICPSVLQLDRRANQRISEAGGRRRGSGGLPPAAPGGSRDSGGGKRFKSTGRDGRVASRHESPGRNGSDFRVWMTGLEPATSWSLTRCATNCATSRGPFFKGTANIGILFRKCKRTATYFSAGGVERASCRAFRADFRAEEAFMRRMRPFTQAKVFRSSFSSSGVKLG